ADRTSEHLQRPQQHAIGNAARVDARNGWNHAAEEIDAELSETFGAEPARH
ncbi:MAG: hypothetical protein H6876_01505, partial [Hyphomicrobiaceae bacterium]|nr:hypothetical protein [Hyphomicrobiaceae bacterium]